ncbi:TPA: chemotaxis protein CheW [Pseudomonas aeruginosa]
MSNDINSGRYRCIGYRIGSTYCLSPSLAVNAITQVPENPTQVPGTKPWLLGATKMDGDIIPFVNIARFLSIPQHAGREEQNKPVALIVRGGTDVGDVGVIVDQLVGFLPSGGFEDAPGADLKIPPGLGACLVGVVADAQRAWAVIDIQALIADPKMQSIDLT